MSNTISKKRTDERGRILNTGESQIKKRLTGITGDTLISTKAQTENPNLLIRGD